MVLYSVGFVFGVKIKSRIAWSYILGGVYKRGCRGGGGGGFFGGLRIGGGGRGNGDFYAQVGYL